MAAKSALMTRLMAVATKNDDGSLMITPEQIEMFLSRKQVNRASGPKERKPRKISGYNLFMKENKGSITKVSAMWKAISDEERAGFNTRAAEIPPTVKPVKTRAPKGEKKTGKGSRGPRGTSAYHLFMKDNRDEFRSDFPEETSGKGAIHRFCATRWAQLKENNDPIVDTYVQRAADSREAAIKAANATAVTESNSEPIDKEVVQICTEIDEILSDSKPEEAKAEESESESESESEGEAEEAKAEEAKAEEAKAEEPEAEEAKAEESESESESEGEAEEERVKIDYQGTTYYHDKSDDLVYDKMEADEPVGEWDEDCIVFY